MGAPGPVMVSSPIWLSSCSSSAMIRSDGDIYRAEFADVLCSDGSKDFALWIVCGEGHELLAEDRRRVARVAVRRGVHSGPKLASRGHVQISKRHQGN